MGSLRREIQIDAPVADAWAAIRDFGAVHERLASGFVIACTLEDDARIVSFKNGTVAREMLVHIDDGERRLVYALTSPRVTHYNASLQVLGETDGRSRVIWTIDFLPNGIEEYLRGQMTEAARAMQSTLERRDASETSR